MTGLTSMSWVFVDDILILKPSWLKRRIGKMHPLDLHRLIETVCTL